MSTIILSNMKNGTLINIFNAKWKKLMQIIHNEDPTNDVILKIISMSNDIIQGCSFALLTLFSDIIQDNPKYYKLYCQDNLNIISQFCSGQIDINTMTLPSISKKFINKKNMKRTNIIWDEMDNDIKNKLMTISNQLIKIIDEYNSRI
jgi:hypothetical protein